MHIRINLPKQAWLRDNLSDDHSKFITEQPRWTLAEDFGMRRLTLNKYIILGSNWLLSSTAMSLQTFPDLGPFRQHTYVLLTVLFSPLLLNSESHSLRCLKGLRKKRQNFQINVLLLQLLFNFIYCRVCRNSIAFTRVCERISVMTDQSFNVRFSCWYTFIQTARTENIECS